jgi:2'-5' RNA ligase
VYSLNARVAPAISRLASELHPRLTPFDRLRERHTLVAKRFETDWFARLRERLRGTLRGTPAFEAQVTGIDYFENPPRGSGPVVYLAVESPGLRALHETLVAEFGAIDELEGAAYVPHVTLARGGSVADAERLAATAVDPVTWTVSQVQVWDARHREAAARISLPA